MPLLLQVVVVVLVMCCAVDMFGSDIMMMALDVTHSTFPHHRDLDLDLRHDLDRSPAGSRNKRLRSATEVTSSSRDSAEQSTVRVDSATRFAATSRGPFSKLKVDRLPPFVFTTGHSAW